MSDGWYPWDSASSEPEDWPRPEGPSEWDLFRRFTEPKVVLSDAALNALARGETTDHMLITFAEGRMTVEAAMGVWDHVLHALHNSEASCPECREVLDVFRRVAETVAEEEDENGSL